MDFKRFIAGTQHKQGGRRLKTAVAIALVCACAILACGQKGDLVLPTDTAARDRATLPQILLPWAAASAPVPTTLPAHVQGVPATLAPAPR